MAAALWIFLILYPILAHSQSGDDETNNVDCEFIIESLSKSNLTCYLAEDDLDVEFATLCKVFHPTECLNATLDQDRIGFQQLEILTYYRLTLYFQGNTTEVADLNLRHIIKIPTPQIANVTYVDDGVMIDFSYQHQYVTNPEFLVEFWGDGNSVKKLMQKVNTQNLKLEGHMLKDSDTYYVHVRARPTEYFRGKWTEWSAVKKFSVNNTEINDPDTYRVPLLILCTSPILVILIGFGILHWWKNIQAYLFPAIPHPKSTVAQIYREKHLPVSFSPEIFKDTNIYPVDYEEEDVAQEFVEDCTGSLESCYKDGTDGSEDKLQTEMSHLKIKLLNDSASPEAGENEAICQSVAVPQGYAKDETYVTMSSLYNTH